MTYIPILTKLLNNLIETERILQLTDDPGSYATRIASLFRLFCSRGWNSSNDTKQG